MSEPLPHIPRKHIKANGRVDLWDVLIEDGPVKIEFTTILAREALVRDAERFQFNLPRGMKPGPAQIAAEARAAEELDQAAAEPPDPAYGRTPA